MELFVLFISIFSMVQLVSAGAVGSKTKKLDGIGKMIIVCRMFNRMR